jgi:hypothetical protein
MLTQFIRWIQFPCYCYHFHMRSRHRLELALLHCLCFNWAPHHAMKEYWGVELYLHAFLTSALGGSEWSASRPSRFTPGKSPWYPSDRRLGGPQNRSGGGGEEKNLQPLPGLEPPIIQPVAQRYTAKLSRLLLLPYHSGQPQRITNTRGYLQNDTIRISLPDCHIVDSTSKENKKRRLWAVRGCIQKFPDWVITK